jgi:hypothetical protein
MVTLLNYYLNWQKNDVDFHWNPHCQVAFDKLKQHLLKILVLTILISQIHSS